MESAHQPIALSLVALLFVVVLALAGWAARRSQVMADTATRARMRYQAVLDNLPGIVLRLEGAPPWSIRMASHKVTALLGKDPASLIGTPLETTDMAPESHYKRVQLAYLLEGIRNGEEEAELLYRYKHPVSGSRWFLARLRRANTQVGTDTDEIDVWLQDVTDRHNAQQRLQIAQSIIQSSRDAIVSMTPEGIVTSWNQGAEQIFGYTAQEVIGTPITRLYRPQDLAEETERLKRIQRHEAVPAYEAVRVGKNGQLCHLYAVLSPIRDELGKVIGVAKIARDASDRILNESLRREVAQAEQMAAMRTAFLARMSHELRTPMTAVLGFSSLLLQSPLTEEQQDHLQSIQVSSQRLLKLLDDILDTAEISKGELALEIADFDLGSLLCEVQAEYKPLAERRGIQLHTLYPLGMPTHFQGDARRIHQMVVNLVDNAIKFTRAGSVRVEATLIDTEVRIDVTDTGVGMTPDQVALIFNPFVQVDSSLSREFGGAGLGTTLCRQLAQLMGGRVEVDSTCGQGSRFSLWLPLALSESTIPTSSSMPHLAYTPMIETSKTPWPASHWVDEDAGTAIWGGEREFWIDSIGQFDNELDEHLQRIASTLQAGQHQKALEAVHALRGSAAAVALPALFRRLDTMESLLRADDLAHAATNLPALQSDAGQTRQQIQHLLGTRVDAAPCATPDGVDVDAALTQVDLLRGQLSRSEIATQTLSSLRQLLAEQAPASIWQQLTGAIDSFDYDRALLALTEIQAWLQALPHTEAEHHEH